MAAVAQDAAQFSPRLQTLAAQLVATAPPRNAVAQLRRVYDFIVRHVAFKPDTHGREHLRHPDQLLSEIAAHGRTAADCDDVSTLTAALLLAMGRPALFVVVNRTGPRADYQHVFPATVLKGRLYPLDAQERVPPGQFPRGIRRRGLFRI